MQGPQEGSEGLRPLTSRGLGSEEALAAMAPSPRAGIQGQGAGTGTWARPQGSAKSRREIRAGPWEAWSNPWTLETHLSWLHEPDSHPH